MISPHGGIEAAGRIHRDQNQAGVLAVRLVDSVDDVFGENRLDFAVDTKLDDGRVGISSGQSWRRGRRGKRNGKRERYCSRAG